MQLTEQTTMRFDGTIESYQRILEWMRACGWTCADEVRYITPIMLIPSSPMPAVRAGEYVLRVNEGFVTSAVASDGDLLSATWADDWACLQRMAHATAVAKGFWPSNPEGRNVGEMVALIHAEASEMLEAIRDNAGACKIRENGQGESAKLPGFSTVEEEAADIVIRLMDFAGGKGLRVGEAIFAKLQYNLTREYKHGKAF